jgi:hypothetical protein
MVELKWKGDELMLGATKMAEVMPVWSYGGASTYQYIIGPEDHISEPYQDKGDAKQDCMRHVRDLLSKAGA